MQTAPCQKFLGSQTFDTNSVGMYCVAAYLNAIQGLTPFLTATQVVQMFNQWAATGYYRPIEANTAVKWDAAYITYYLTSTIA